VSAASTALRAAAIGVREAALEEGIDLNGPLGVWVRSQERVLTAQAQMAEEHDKNVIGLVKDTKVTVENQVETLRVTLRVAEEHNKRTQMASQHMQIQQETLVSRTVSDLTEQVSAKLSGALVLRQRRYDRTHFWGSIGLVTSLALALFFGGFALHAYEWRNETGALQRCMKTALRNTAGVWYCEMRSIEGW
jgi:hypothetical protein